MRFLTLMADLTISNTIDFEYHSVFFRLKNPFVPSSQTSRWIRWMCVHPCWLMKSKDFPSAGKMDGVAVLLHVMPEMETAGSVSQSLAADDKEDLHEFLPDELVLIPDEMLVLPTGSHNRFSCLPGAGFFRGDNPCNETDDETGLRERRVSATRTSRMTVGSTAGGSPGPAPAPPGIFPSGCMVQPLHADEFGFKD